MAVYLSLTLTQGTQEIANNRTYVTVNVYARSTNSSYNNNNKPGTVVLDGTSFSFSHSFGKNTTTLLASKSKWVYHDSAGNKTVSASASYVTGVSSGTIKASGSKALSKIPRVSDLSLNKSSVPADALTTVIATATKKSSSFTDTLSIKLGSYSQTITSGTEFTIPKEWMNAISATSATATVTVTTKSGSTSIGSKSVNLTVTVPDEIKPKINGITVSEAVSSVTDAFGNRFVKNLSILNVVVSASGAYGSTISSYSTKFEGVTYIGDSFQVNTLKSAGTINAVTTVTDSRGRTATFTKAITAVDYAPPVITNMTYYPCNADGTRNANGTNTKIIINGSISSVSGQNTRSLILKYKALDATSYTELTLITSDWTFEVSTIISGTDPTSTWEFIAVLEDKISGGDAATTYRVVTGVPVISRLAGGKGIRFFGEAEEEGFVIGNVDYSISDDEYNELMTLLGGVARLIDWIYPVGHVITTVNSSYDPNKLFKNQTWVRFASGQTLVGVDEDDTDFGEVEKTGGEKKHTLTSSEMPSHSHSISTDSRYILGSVGAITRHSCASGSGHTNILKSASSTVDRMWKGTVNTGGSGPHNNLQPYVTVYFWKRTA